MPKINLSVVLDNVVTGKPLEESKDKPLTLEFIVVESLAQPMSPDTTPLQMVERFDLIKKVKTAEDSIVTLKAEEVSLLKALITKSFPAPIIAGAALIAIETPAE
jgi:hypothetical protein